jgi:hypothetical protein
MFASYSSTADGTPIYIPALKSITLRFVDHRDGTGAVCLFLTSAEATYKRYPREDYPLNQHSLTGVLS